MGLTPDFRVVANSRDITDRIRDRLLSLRLSDQAGIESDQVEIALDDRDSQLAMLETGAELEISLGYSETGVVGMGLYTVDELTLSGPPQAMTIRAKAADMGDRQKEQKTRSWDDVTLGGIVETLASEYDLTASVAPELAKKSYKHLDQTGESDLAFLTRLAEESDALFKVGGGKMIMVPRGEGKSASGEELPVVVISKTQIKDWNVTLKDRGKFASATAQYRDKDKAETVTVTAGDPDAGPASAIRHTYPDEASAKAAAEARLKEVSRGTSSISLTVGGNPSLAAEGKIKITGVREGVDGEWLVTSVEHTLDGSGYACRISGEVPNGEGEE